MNNPARELRMATIAVRHAEIALRQAERNLARVQDLPDDSETKAEAVLALDAAQLALEDAIAAHEEAENVYNEEVIR